MICFVKAREALNDTQSLAVFDLGTGSGCQSWLPWVKLRM